MLNRSYRRLGERDLKSYAIEQQLSGELSVLLVAFEI